MLVRPKSGPFLKQQLQPNYNSNLLYVSSHYIKQTRFTKLLLKLRQHINFPTFETTLPQLCFFTMDGDMPLNLMSSFLY